MSLTDTCCSEMDVETGKIKWFNADKGYGFIKPDSGGGDVFVHVPPADQATIMSLDAGQKVRFELRNTDSGKMQAEHLSTFDA